MQSYAKYPSKFVSPQLSGMSDWKTSYHITQLRLQADPAVL